MGVGHHFGARVSHLEVDLQLDLGVAVQWGHLHTEAGLQYTPQAYQLETDENDWQWGNLGARLATGYRTKGTGWGVDILVGYRIGVLRPILLSCTEVSDNDYLCGYERDGDQVIYPRATSHTPHLILRLRRQLGPWAVGLNLIPELSTGRVRSHKPPPSLATHNAIQYNVESDSQLWRSFGGRLSLHLQRNF